MKIACACGTKYSFDLTPEMVREPIRFVCQNCGVDSSEMVNELIRQHFGVGSQATPAPQPRVVAVVRKPAPAAEVEAPQSCQKHIGELTTHRCLVCQKPICPKCMELFGYVCSAHCKGKAELQGMDIPVYANQKAVVEARHWRKIGRIAVASVLMALAVLGVWIWYAWVGSTPRVAFSVRFPEAGYSGQCRLCPQNQIVFLHGGMLARHDIKAKKEIWSHWLIDKKKIAEQAVSALEQMKAASARAAQNGRERWDLDLPNVSEMALDMERAAAEALELHVERQNVWIASPQKLVRFDWEAGQPIKEIAWEDGFSRLVRKGDEFLLISEKETGGQMVNHIHLASGESRTEGFAVAAPPALAANAANSVKLGTAPGGRSSTNKLAAPPRTAAAAAATRTGSNQAPAMAGGKTNQAAVPPALATGRQPTARPLDPAAIAARVQNLPLPNRLALPATLAANANQQRLMAEMRGDSGMAPIRAGTPPEEFEHSSLILAPDGFVQFSVKLIEHKTVAHEAMKAPPKKSALEGTVNAAATAAIANEILNEIQRDHVGSVVVEDVSRYQVTLRRPGEKGERTGEVVGLPQLFPLKTVDVLAAGKSILVFNKTNKKLWESKLNYSVSGGADPLTENPPYGQGPCVERGDMLYIFDEGVLSAFALATGNARWRLPSVGVAGLHFDDEGMLYVNTTTASPEQIKYSRQIDVTEKTRQAVLKVDPKTGKMLWTSEAEGFITHISGKFLYTVQSHAGDDDGGGLLGRASTTPAHVRIKRLHPDDGRVLWEHYQRRAPLDVQFDKNTIQLLFKKEFQFLKFLSL